MRHRKVIWQHWQQCRQQHYWCTGLVLSDRQHEENPYDLICLWFHTCDKTTKYRLTSNTILNVNVRENRGWPHVITRRDNWSQSDFQWHEVFWTVNAALLPLPYYTYDHSPTTKLRVHFCLSSLLPTKIDIAYTRDNYWGAGTIYPLWSQYMNGRTDARSDIQYETV